jgi:hypothetical protein
VIPESNLEWFIAYVCVGVITFPILRLLVYFFHRKEDPSIWVREVLAALEKDKPLKDRILKVLSVSSTAVVVVFIWPITTCIVIYFILFDKQGTPHDDPDEPSFACKKEDLIVKVTPEEVEVMSYVSDPLGRSPNVPFGHLYQGWISLLGQLESEDELWSFKTKGWTPDSPGSPKFSGPVYVRSGYAVVRGKKIVAAFVSEG